MGEFPELEKIERSSLESQAIGVFLEWLRSRDYEICSLMETHSDYLYVPIGKSIEQLLAEYFYVDLVKAEEERREILSRLRGEQDG